MPAENCAKNLGSSGPHFFSERIAVFGHCFLSIINERKLLHAYNQEERVSRGSTNKSEFFFHVGRLIGGSFRTTKEAQAMADDVFAMFVSEDVKVVLVYTKFVSLVKFDPMFHTLLPLSIKGEAREVNENCVDEMELLSQVNEEEKITEQEIPMLPNPLQKELLMDWIDIKYLGSEAAKHLPISTNVGPSHKPFGSTGLDHPHLNLVHHHKEESSGSARTTLLWKHIAVLILLRPKKKIK
ncbi:hypothetical protein Lal_00004588 [Lupinus albus]|nr:hypothetical protein Lal_00004588 [Lupinus albus]